MKSFITSLSLLWLTFSLLACAYPPPTGTEIIENMHQKWAGKWCKNMAFEQEVYFYKNDTLVKQEVWQEMIKAPSFLHIRFNGFETGNGAIFRNDSIYHFANGEMKSRQKLVHYLLLLASDVYFLESEETIEKLKNLGFDLSRTFESKTLYIVGTDNANDSTSSQFWINKENLYLTKVLLNNSGNISEVEVGGYQTIEGYPVATEISFKTNGKLNMIEKYFNLSFPETVDDSIFDIHQFKNTIW